MSCHSPRQGKGRQASVHCPRHQCLILLGEVLLESVNAWIHFKARLHLKTNLGKDERLKTKDALSWGRLILKKWLSSALFTQIPSPLSNQFQSVGIVRQKIHHAQMHFVLHAHLCDKSYMQCAYSSNLNGKKRHLPWLTLNFYSLRCMYCTL